MSGRSELDPRTGNSLEEFQRDLADNLCYERGTTVESASAQDVYWTLAVTIRDRLADRRVRTARANYLAWAVWPRPTSKLPPAGSRRAPEDGHVMFEFPRAGTFVPTGSARISICLHDELNLAVLFPLGPK